MRQPLITLAAVLTTVAMNAPSADARPFFQKGSVEFGLQLGGLFFLEGDSVPFDPAGPGFPGPLEDTFTYTAHGSYNFSRHLGLELALQLSPAEVNRLSVLALHLDAIYHPLTHDWFVPFVGAGASFSFLLPQGDYANDTDPGLNLVAGVKLLPWDHIGFRADVRYVLRIATGGDAADGREDITGHDLVASIGLFGTLGNEVEKKEIPVILDTDGDGILDQVDACPNVPGQASAQGCPDKDGDSLADDKDRCPDIAGAVAQQGCPDSDGDTLVDIDDRCPDKAGPVPYKGCPDTDEDTIVDVDDRCPTIKGVPEHGGCPPPPPIELVKKFSGAIKGITFEQDKDVIRKTSFPTLDEAIKVMQDYPQLRLLVEGHTSSEGTREHNLDLSERRAKAVRQYMMDKGIAGDRIDTKGFGPDVPVAKNTTAGGRAKNRRIEFKIFQPE